MNDQAIIVERIHLYPPVVSAVHGELITDCEADEGYEIAFWGGTDDITEEVKRSAMNAYISFRLKGLHEYLHHPQAINNIEERSDYWKRRFGATLGYNGYYLSSYIDTDMLEQIRLANPAKLLAQGLMQLDSLTFDEGRAEEKPEFLQSVFVEAIANQDMSYQEVETVFEHLKQLAAHDQLFYERFIASLDTITATAQKYS